MHYPNNISHTLLFSKRIKKALSLVALWMFMILPSLALDPSDGTIPLPNEDPVTQNGYTSRTASNVKTYDIPITNYPSSITVNLRGGDGGFAQSGRNSNPTFKASKGGGGIEGTATFNIHPTNAGALRPGGQIRLIPGNKGYDRQSGLYARAASGGGGGSGLIYHGPLATDDWRPLIIAGGGGGAYASSVAGASVSGRNGGAGQSSESGQRGFGNGVPGGTNGNGPTSISGANELGGSGGGWFTGGAHGGGAGYPAGGAGGVLNVNTNKGAHGGFGCGGGGDGGKVTTASYSLMSGGGGGGYSGGGGGEHKYGGGGGGSFVATGQTLSGTILPIAHANANRWTPRAAGLKQHGYVTIQTGGALRSEALPTITAQNITIDFATTTPYASTGVLAQDIYGRPINFTVTSNNVNVNVSGTYTMTYQATDQYGQTATGSRNVTVRAGSLRPTFSLPAALSITQAGQQTVPLVTNFKPNTLGDTDVVENLVRYEVRGNSNPSLLVGDPTIANNGHITLTPSGTAPGITTLTIVAIDNGPDPSVRESVADTVDIRINLAPTPAQFLISSNPDVFSTSIGYTENSSNFIVGTLKSNDTDNPNDLIYELGGIDSGAFTLGSTDGVLRFKAAQNFENPNDAGGDGTYNLQITARDPNAIAQLGSSIVSDVTVSLVDINEPPSQPTLTNTNVPENTTVVGILNSTDPDTTNNTVSFEIEDNLATNGSFFQITTVNNQHQLEFLSAPDYEDAQDFGNDNSYTVSVRASSNGQSASKLFTVHVTQVEESLSVPVLTITNDPVYENQTVIGTVTAEDPDGTEVTYSLSEIGGTDWERVSIDPTTGVLSFLSAPDYESPDDFNENRIYDINVLASSGGENINRSFTITLNNVDEAPSPPLINNSDAVTAHLENETVVGNLSSTDPEGDTISYSVSTTEGADSDKFTIYPNSNTLLFINAPDFENPTNAGPDPFYEVVVIASSTTYTTKSTLQITVDNIVEAPSTPVLNAPLHPEKTKTIGFVSSTSPLGNNVVFSLSDTEGADRDKLQITSSGELGFIQTPNYEVPHDSDTNNVYEVVVIASSDGESTSNTVSVQVIDAIEPTPYLEVTETTVLEGQSNIARARIRDRDSRTFTFSISQDTGADNDKVQIDTSTGELSFITIPDFESPHDTGADNTFEFVVVASDSLLTINLPVTITIIDSTTNSIAEFRSSYNLAADGSEDFHDRSGNGIPNIGYMILGLGDPSNPRTVPVSDNSPGTPKVAILEEYDKIITYTYSMHSGNLFDSSPEASLNLKDWIRPLSPSDPDNPELTPIGMETTPINAEYSKVTLFYLRTEDPSAPEGTVVYPKLYFRMHLSHE